MAKSKAEPRCWAPKTLTHLLNHHPDHSRHTPKSVFVFLVWGRTPVDDRNLKEVENQKIQVEFNTNVLKNWGLLACPERQESCRSIHHPIKCVSHPSERNMKELAESHPPRWINGTNQPDGGYLKGLWRIFHALPVPVRHTHLAKTLHGTGRYA